MLFACQTGTTFWLEDQCLPYFYFFAEAINGIGGAFCVFLLFCVLVLFCLLCGLVLSVSPFCG